MLLPKSINYLPQIVECRSHGPNHMSLSGKQFQQLHKAILDAYPSVSDLTLMVRFELEENIDTITSDKNLSDSVYELIEWAESTGRTDKLIIGANNQNPGNLKLNEFIQQRNSSKATKPFNQSSIKHFSASSDDGELSEGCFPTYVGLSVSILAVTVLGLIFFAVWGGNGQLSNALSSLIDIVPTRTTESRNTSNVTLSNNSVDTPSADTSASPTLSVVTLASPTSLASASTIIEFESFRDSVLLSDFVHIPAGNFFYGSTQSEIEKGLSICQQYSGNKCHIRDFDNEIFSGNTDFFGGSNSIPIDEFWIMEHEVTNAQFDSCIQAGHCQVLTGNTRAHGLPDHPVRLLESSDAKDFARWACGRLPTELEWEKAARGTDSRIYPWGNEWVAQNANSCDDECSRATVTGVARPSDGYETTAPVISFDKGRSPYGLYHMVGNVREWVTTVWEHQGMDSAYMLKGGSFYDFPDVMRSAERLRWPKDDDGTITAGFRIVRDRVDGCLFN